MKRLNLLAIILLTLASGKVYAQNQQLYFEHLTSEEGLSQNDVNCIYQDSKGFMWFGTHDGLNKYDGHNFTIYKPDPNNPHSISSNLIFSIAEDQQGNLWIGTTGAGIDKFDRKTEQFTQYRHDPQEQRSLSNDYVITTYVDKTGNVWVGTNNGLNKLVMDSTANRPPEITRFFADPNDPNSLSNNNINSIYQDHLGVLWVGTQNGLNSMLLTDAVPKFTHYALDASMIRDIKEDDAGNLYVGTDEGFFYASSEEVASASRFHQLAAGSFRSIEIDNQGVIWTGTNLGLYRFEKKGKDNYPQLEGHYTNEVLNPNSLSKNLIRSIYKDKTGIIWIGTNGGGVNKYVPENNKFRHFMKNPHPGSISYNKIRSIFEDSGGTLWIGTEGGGLNQLPAGKDEGNYANFDHLDTPKRVFALTESAWANKSILWIGSEDNNSLSYISLNAENGNKPPHIHLGVNHDFEIENSVFTLLEDHHGTLWVGTYNGGLFRLVPDENGVYDEVFYFRHNPSDENSISNNIIRNLLEDRHGNLWIGTGDGLNKIPKEDLDSDRPSFKRYKNVPGDTTSISHNYILAMYESEAGDLWIGTFGGGLNKFIREEEGQERFVQYSEKDGLPNNVIKGILEDDQGNLWIATNKGLSRFNPVTETFKNYDVSDGLQSNEFSELACFKRKDGEMLFGGVNGFNAFYPDSIRDNPYVPQIAITDFEILNEPVAVGEKKNGRVILEQVITATKTLALRYFENSFSFGFSALHYAAPSKNQYAYKLEGFDKDWIHTTARRPFATYTNLRHGEYTFKVKASNNDGIWNDTPVTLRIAVAPPFWLTWWAYLIYAVLLMAALWVFWKYTLIDIHKKHQLELEHLEKEKTEELHQMKLRFFTNISHEFRTPLTLILGPLEQLLKSEETLATGERKRQYGLMHKNAKYLLRLVNQLMDFRRMDQGKMPLKIAKGNVVQFVSEITEPFQFIASKKNIDFQIHTYADEAWLWFDEDKVEKILHNLLSNAFKFTPEKGTIQVAVSTETTEQKKSVKEYIVLSVKDDGPGISSEQMDHIFERFYQVKTYEKSKKEGAGIGLSFTKSLVELHHGHISVTSEEGKETFFKVMLPVGNDHFRKEDFVEEKGTRVAKENEPEIYEWTGEEEIPNDREYVMTKGKGLPLLLVVDDHADIRKFIRQNFASAYNIVEAENGVKGLKIAVNTTPDLIIGDIMMPEMDGLEMCHQLKTDQRTSHIPIILLTAKDTEENELEGMKTGADLYISKPFNLEILQVSVRNLIKSRQDLRKKFIREISLEPGDITVTTTDEDFLKKAMGIIEEYMDDTEFNVETLVKELGTSRSNLYLKIKALTDLSTSEFIRTVRMKRAVQLLENSDLSVKEIMYQSGFNTASYFSKCFKKQFGMIPSEYVKKYINRQEEVL